jgi:hypothetical protein
LLGLEAKVNTGGMRLEVILPVFKVKPGIYLDDLGEKKKKNARCPFPGQGKNQSPPLYSCKSQELLIELIVW